MPSISLGTAAIGAAGSIGGLLGGGNKPAGQTTTTTTQVPWSVQQPYLQQGFNTASSLLNAGGPTYYPGPGIADPNNMQSGFIDALAQYGSNPTALQTTAQNAATGIAGGNAINTAGYYQPIASGQYQNTAGVGPLSNIASGGAMNLGGLSTLADAASGNLANTQGTDTLKKYSAGDMLSAQNPYFQQMANTIKAQVQPGIDAQFANGRLDSGLGTRAEAQGLGDAIGGLAYQNYQQGLGQQQSAANSLANIGAQNVGTQLSGAQGLQNLGQQNLGNQINASSILSGIGQGNIGNILNASQGLTGIGAQNAGLQLSAAGMAPSLNGMNLTQLGALGTAGDTQQQQQQNMINQAMAQWNFNENRPQTALQNYMGAVQGNYGSTGTQSTPYFTNPTANALSSGLGAAGLFNSLFGGGGASSGAGGAIANSGGSNWLNLF